MGFVLGLNAKLFINTYANDVGVARGAWPGTGLPQTSAPADIPEFTNVRNLRLDLEGGEADITTRGGGGWRQFAATLLSGSLEFESIWDPDDAAFTTVFQAFLDRDTLQAVALDKETVGGQGLWADYVITNMSRNEDLEEALTMTVTMRPSRGTLDPTWETVG